MAIGKNRYFLQLMKHLGNLVLVDEQKHFDFIFLRVLFGFFCTFRTFRFVSLLLHYYFSFLFSVRFDFVPFRVGFSVNFVFFSLRFFDRESRAAVLKV